MPTFIYYVCASADWTDTVGNMEDMNATVAGNIAETITCNTTGNVAIVGMDNTSGKWRI